MTDREWNVLVQEEREMARQAQDRAVKRAERRATYAGIFLSGFIAIAIALLHELLRVDELLGLDILSGTGAWIFVGLIAIGSVGMIRQYS